MIFALCIVGLVALGTGIEMGIIPESSALPSGKIHPRYIKTLRELKVIEEDEKVLFFYSTSLFSIAEDGNLFTDRRAISYQQADGELEIGQAFYHEIESIEMQKSTEWAEDSVITITKKDEEWFILFVDSGSDIDTVFFNKLKKQWDIKKDEIPEN